MVYKSLTDASIILNSDGQVQMIFQTNMDKWRPEYFVYRGWLYRLDFFSLSCSQNESIFIFNLLFQTMSSQLDGIYIVEVEN